MKIILSIISAVSINLSVCQDFLLENNISSDSISTEHVIASPGNGFPHSVTPPEISKWNNGYIVSYTSMDYKSYIFFTDANFIKTSSEIEIENKFIYDIETSNGEIAMLTGKPVRKNSYDSEFIYFTKIDESGNILIDNKIVGSKNIRLPGKSDFYHVPDQKLNWTGSHYVAFFTVHHNWMKLLIFPDVHEGDATYFIEPNGKILSFDEWGTSHSFEERLAVRDNYVAYIASGDGNPRGISFRILNTQSFNIENKKLFNHDFNNRKLDFIKIPENNYKTVYNLPDAKGNYIPFSIGDILLNNHNDAIISFATKENRKYFDLGFAKVSSNKDNEFNGVTMLTNTEDISEHSERIVQLKNGNYLIFWKQYNGKQSEKELSILEKEIKDKKEIFLNHNIDQNMAAIINDKGEFIVYPQEIHNSNWYYNCSLMEFSTNWHYYIRNNASYKHSDFKTDFDNNIIWTYNKPFSKLISIYSYVE